MDTMFNTKYVLSLCYLWYSVLVEHIPAVGFDDTMIGLQVQP
jgi:hypothetical protein